MNKLNTLRSGVDENGHFGIYGGRFVAETLMPLILDVEKAGNMPVTTMNSGPSSTI